MEKSMSEIMSLFPMCLYKKHMEKPYSEMILQCAEKNKTSYITSDKHGDSFYQNNPEFQDFFIEITKAVKEYCFQIGYDTDKFDFYVTRAWVNNFDNSDATINRHTHTPSDISISYYPSDSLSPICFENTAKPNEVLQNSFSHDELFLNRNMFSYNCVYVSPEKNTLLVFPSKTYHWVDRVAKEVEHRVSFSADFIMVLKENMRSYEHVRNPINSWRKF